MRVFGVQIVDSEAVPQPSVALYIAGRSRDCGLIVFIVDAKGMMRWNPKIAALDLC
jgi:Mg-chelatase subunit ChlD